MTQSEYDYFAEKFSETRTQAWSEFEFFLSELKKQDRILDLGCGNGRVRNFLPKEIIPEGNYFGFDLSEKLLKIARNQNPKDHFFKGDFAQTLPFGSENFEMVISIAAFHHLLNKQDQLNFLKECFRILKPGGKIFITTWILPKKYFWMNFWKGRVFTKNWIVPFGQEKHIRTYHWVSEKDLKKLLEKSGFKVTMAQRFENRNFIALAEKTNRI